MTALVTNTGQVAGCEVAQLCRRFRVYVGEELALAGLPLSGGFTVTAPSG